MRIRRSLMRIFYTKSRTSVSKIVLNVLLSSGIFFLTGYAFVTAQFQGSNSSHSSKPYSTGERQFCVIPNAVIADHWTQSIDDADHVTLVTHSSVNYLNSALEQSRLWDGPISYALFADHWKKLKKINLALSIVRYCETDFRRKVSVHLFYPSDSSTCPVQRLHSPELDLNFTHCQLRVRKILHELGPEPLSIAMRSKSYPVNIARNIARRAAFTELTLVADVELMPSRGLASRFMEFYKNRHRPRPREAFVIPVFELTNNRPLPRTKDQLHEEMRQELAVPFHYKRIAYECHRIPAIGKWWTSGEKNRSSISIFVSVPWIRPCWEPVFLSVSRNTPPYDERFRGYGKNKIQQVYEMCRANFTFHILDNAFLIHYNISTLSEGEWKDISSTVTRNNELYERFKRELDGRYTDQKQRRYCDTAIPWGTPFVKSL